ncbi:MAG: L,D-transpeptidase family protein [Alphaproteobacteria bacterium]|nr:L,D-transpeptidase family protein [Alphaproteobacteria bacterium]
MKQRRFALLLALGGFLLFAPSAHAAPNSGAIQRVLSEPGLAVEQYELGQEALNAFYAARDYRAAWDFNPRDAEALSGFLNSLELLVAYHGFRRENYALGMMPELGKASDDASRLKLELLASDTLLKLAYDLHGEQVDLEHLYPGWDFERGHANIPGDLNAAVSTGKIADYIASLAPKNPAYDQLAQALKNYREFKTRGEWPKIDAGPSLRLHDRGPRVAQLRARLAAEDYLISASLTTGEKDIFDEQLKGAVEAYQMRNGLDADGRVGAKTLQALNTSLAVRIDQIRANMERWRHMPDDYPPARYALVNIANASITIMDNGTPLYRGPVIVGKVDRKTPFIQSAVRSMIINPAWHVPAKIARKDILPKLQKDPHYLEKLGFVIKGSHDDPYGENIDWKSMPEREFNFRLRQSPGDMNSLGHLKFDFDNDFAVYMHGTPHPELFKKSDRAQSSGCVRLRDPERVAEILLAGNKTVWDEAHLNEEIKSGKTRWLPVTEPLPLFILYWTVFTDEDGKVNFRNDIYGYDTFLTENLPNDSKMDKSP